MFPSLLLILATINIAPTVFDWNKAATDLSASRLELEKVQQQLLHEQAISQHENVIWQNELAQQKLALTKSELRIKALEKEIAQGQRDLESQLLSQNDDNSALHNLLSQMQDIYSSKRCLPDKSILALSNIQKQLANQQITAGEAAYLINKFISTERLANHELQLSEEVVILPSLGKKLLPVVSFGQTLFYVQLTDHQYGLFLQLTDKCQYLQIDDSFEVAVIDNLFALGRLSSWSKITQVVLP